nr:sugar nucleotide-binding protein [Candidatus Gracilibacteria bacterium]
IYGAQGNLGQFLTYLWWEQAEIIPLDRCNADISDFAALNKLFQNLDIDLIINAAAIHRVNMPENLYFEVNAKGAANLAAIALSKQCQLWHFSCAQVLSGSVKKDPKAKLAPLDIISKSKAEGEELISKILPKSQYRIIRLGEILGPNSMSWANNILNLVKKSPKLNLLDSFRFSISSTDLIDQVLTPALTNDQLANITHLTHPEIWTPATWGENIKKHFSLERELSTFSEELSDSSLVSSFSIPLDLDKVIGATK